ncbi:MAG: CBS domain-containing protein [Chloroflexota bacterium]
MLAKDIMSTSIVTIGVRDSMAKAARLMLDHRINALPVLDEQGRLAGMIGIRDVLRVPLPSHSDSPIIKWTRLEEKAALLSKTCVREVMNRRVVSVGDTATVIEVAALMANRGVHPIPIMRDGQLLGVVGRADVARALLGLAEALDY